MKKIIAIALCLMMTIPMMTSCHKYEAEINVYNWGEYMANGSEGSMKIVKDFEKKFNVKVNYTTFDSNEVMYDKLKSTNLSYDVIIP
ncbi:MAG: spermidine/putrescine ABC transporter substrate-binding protein, partial [Oscillospiraceae bacterium]